MISLGLSNFTRAKQKDLLPSVQEARKELLPSVQEAISLTAAWCSLRTCEIQQLRSPELDPSADLKVQPFCESLDIETWIQAKNASYDLAVSKLNQRRAELFRMMNSGAPKDVDFTQTRGRVLLYAPMENVSDGASEASSRGFFDGEDAPPWDLWFRYKDGTIFSWVPERLVSAAQAGIDANPVDCIHWADNAPKKLWCTRSTRVAQP
jgi:hypothetical protein